MGVLMYAQQLDLIEPNDDISLMKRENADLWKAQDNLRKGLFARHNGLDKRWIESERKVDILERRIAFLEKNLSAK